MDKKLKDIYWLAGLLEGEGTFGNYSSGPVIQVNMTDYDVIEKVHKILKCSSKISTFKSKTFKQTYIASLNGNRAIGWMFTLYSLMSKRRQEKIKESINIWKSYKRQTSRTQRKIIIINGERICLIHGPIKAPNIRYRGNRKPDCKACYKVT